MKENGSQRCAWLGDSSPTAETLFGASRLGCCAKDLKGNSFASVFEAPCRKSSIDIIGHTRGICLDVERHALLVLHFKISDTQILNKCESSVPLGLQAILKNVLGFDFCNECMFPKLDLGYIYSIVRAQCRIGFLMFRMSPSEPRTILDRHRFWCNAWLRVTGACFMLQKGSRHDVWRFVFFRTGMFSTFCKQPVVSFHHFVVMELFLIRWRRICTGSENTKQQIRFANAAAQMFAHVCIKLAEIVFCKCCLRVFSIALWMPIWRS